jgi:hypothetical protein
MPSTRKKMTYRTTNQSASICVIRRQIILLLAIGAQGALCTQAAAQPHVLKWNIEATIYSITDPHKVFPDVRLGDNVRGTMAYNLNANRLWDESFSLAYFFHGATFPVTEMVIENPRTGVDLEFKLDEAGGESAVYLEKDQGAPGSESDYFYTSQPVLVPVPLPSEIGDDFGFPSVEVFLGGPRGTLANTKLPSELDLNDWSLADISFYDNWTYSISDTRLEATIYSLTPVPFESVPGDFDADGDADARDYTIWGTQFGNSEIDEDAMDSDASGNGEIDAADYVVWRHAVAQNAPNNASIPEPATILSLMTALVVGLARRRYDNLSSAMGLGQRCWSSHKCTSLSAPADTPTRNGREASTQPSFLRRRCSPTTPSISPQSSSTTHSTACRASAWWNPGQHKCPSRFGSSSKRLKLSRTASGWSMRTTTL